MSFKVLKEKVAIVRDQIQEKTESGLFIASTQFSEKPMTGIVVAVGSDVVDIKIGDKIQMEKGSKGIEVVVGIEKVLIVEQKYIAAILE